MFRCKKFKLIINFFTDGMRAICTVFPVALYSTEMAGHLVFFFSPLLLYVQKYVNAHKRSFVGGMLMFIG